MGVGARVEAGDGELDLEVGERMDLGYEFGMCRVRCLGLGGMMEVEVEGSIAES